ncbi:MAG: hypothetical protein Q8R07_01645 [Candidatus Uhrbacteria bacterium]|nr:hypothetical protein [Candidatus Uhrbacteria bacterium]
MIIESLAWFRQSCHTILSLPVLLSLRGTKQSPIGRTEIASSQTPRNDYRVESCVGSSTCSGGGVGAGSGSNVGAGSGAGTVSSAVGAGAGSAIGSDTGADIGSDDGVGAETGSVVVPEEV